MSTRGPERPSESELEEVRAAREEQPEREVPTGGDRAADCLTPRDWFAGKALSGLAGNHQAIEAMRQDARLSNHTLAEEAAEFAFELADAMLVERAKTRSV